MNPKTAQNWLSSFSQKMQGKPFFSSDFETCVANFVSGSHTTWFQSDTMQQACEISTLEMEQMYGDAYKHYQANRVFESEKLFRLLVLLDPFVDKYWLGLAACLQLLERYEEALKGYSVLACLDETSPYPHFYASECLKHLNRKDEEQQAMKIAYQYASSSSEYAELLQSIKKEI